MALEIKQGLWCSLDDALLGFRVSPGQKVTASVKHYWFILSSHMEGIHWAVLFCVTIVIFGHKRHKEVASTNCSRGKRKYSELNNDKINRSYSRAFNHHNPRRVRAMICLILACLANS